MAGKNSPTMFEAIPDGFTEWHGGDNPVYGKRCEVIFRHKNTLSTKPRQSGDWCWHQSNSGGDIIAYRVI